MSDTKKVSIIGGDLRQVYMTEILCERNFEIYAYGIFQTPTNPLIHFCSSLDEAMNSSNIVICPIPFTRDKLQIYSEVIADDLSIDHFISLVNEKHIICGGNIPNKVSDYLNINKIMYLDFMEMDQISIQNTIATAEGTILEAIKNSTLNLHQSNALIIGYGKCAKVLAKKLQGLDVNVTITARNPKDLYTSRTFGYDAFPLCDLTKQISTYQYIFNTVPALIIDADVLHHVSNESIIIDIASKPGGVDFVKAKELGVNASLHLGLPGKYAPKASARFLCDALNCILE